MRKVSQFLRKADKATKKSNSRFSDPFFAFVEDKDGNIIWTEDLPEENKRRILKRAGRDAS